MALALVAFPTVANAQCAFDGPFKARGIKTDMTRAYIPCGTSITFASPNTAGKSGTPGCTPPTPRSAYQFGPKGACDYRVFTRTKDPCPSGAPGPCQELSFQTRCKDILLPDGMTPIDGVSGSGWYIRTILRATFDDDSFGDMTAIDSPGEYYLGEAKKGKLKLKLALYPCVGGDCGFFGPINPFPVCSSFEILSVAIIDPDGAIFATPGTSTR